jgi:outer membrane lipoprotein SlyB
MRNRSITAALLLAALASTAQAQSPKNNSTPRTSASPRAMPTIKNCAAKNRTPASACNACATPRPNTTNRRRWPRPSTKPARPSPASAATAARSRGGAGEKAGEGSALGLIAGGVAGALLGNQVGSGHGRQLATVAGAPAAPTPARKSKRKPSPAKQWTVHVQYDDGRQAAFNFDHDPQMMSGDRVQNSNGSIVRR